MMSRSWVSGGIPNHQTVSGFNVRLGSTPEVSDGHENSAFGAREEADFGRSVRGERRNPLRCRDHHSWLPTVGMGTELLSRMVTPPEAKLE